MPAFSVYTLGCKVNQYETEAISEMLSQKGYTELPYEGKKAADIYIINTCSVTAAADAKNRNVIRQALRKNSNAVIVVTGCYGQSAGKQLIETEGVSIVTGTGNRTRIPELIEEYLLTGRKIIEVRETDFKDNRYEPLSVKIMKGHTRAFIKIQDGCTQFCTYCIIPFTRGAQRSRSLEDLRKEIEGLAKAGYREIVLTGINLTSFGQDLPGKPDIVDAVETVSSVEGIERVRLGSLEPVFFTEDRIERLSKVKKLCRQYHLALQSGSYGVLKRMNRHYTPEDFEKIRNTIMKYMPDSSFTTDIMVGFPGETEEEHRESMDFAKRIGFSKMHVFPYSVRPGTAACKMKNQVPSEVKKRRAAEMGELAEKLREDFMRRLIGTVQNVLIEEKIPGGFRGFAENYAEVVVRDADCESPGRTVRVLITDSEGEMCFGTIKE